MAIRVPAVNHTSSLANFAVLLLLFAITFTNVAAEVIADDVLLSPRNPFKGVRKPKRAAIPNPSAQTDGYQYTGGVYVVGADGSQFSQAAPAICPANAPQSCGNIAVWNW